MDTSSLKSFATWARISLMRDVAARLGVVLAPSSPERLEHPLTVTALEQAIRAAGGGESGRASVTERVAYTWFNRIIALRFMDANGYTDSCIVSPRRGQASGQPQILADAKGGVIDSNVVSQTVNEAVTALLRGTRRSADPQGEAYSLLLAEYCRHWQRTMPFMFEREGDYTELLIPANLLARDSVLARAVSVLTEDTCQDVEVIGWLYQFYISDRKDEVFAGFKKNKKAGAAEIPAATQLFTPHWIVRYLVENSLGRLWMLNHPDSALVKQMDYYIAPVQEETDFLKVANPEELTVVDPACGSGHMLTYAFDLLYAIYEEQGYAPLEIPGLILKHNLFGIEIDGRAGALAAFALTMKARARQRTFFNRQVAPNICVLEPIDLSASDLEFLVTAHGNRQSEKAFWNQFVDADTFGSLIRPDPELTVRLAEHLGTLDGEGNMVHAHALTQARQVVHQAEYLARRYHVAVANPPYMGSKQMNALLSQFMRDEYPDSKSDLFAAFIERCVDFARPGGAAAMITMQSWMFLSSYEKLRASLLAHQQINSMLHLGARAFDSIGGEVVSSTAFVLENRAPGCRGSSGGQVGTFLRLIDGASEAEKVTGLRAALSARTKESGFHIASGKDFAAVPGSPIVYWLSEKMLGSFATGRPLSDVADLRQGLATADNNRFLRRWWEVSGSRTAFSCASREAAAESGARWFPYNKGGEFRKWYGNHEYVLNWEHDGAEIVAFKPRSVIRNPRTYFSPSVSWSDISSGEAAFRRYPAGFVHDSTGHSGFGATVLLHQIASLLNSKYVLEVMKVLAPTMHFHIGYVGLVPVSPGVEKLPTAPVEDLVDTARADWDLSETSWNFERNPLVALI